MGARCRGSSNKSEYIVSYSAKILIGVKRVHRTGQTRPVVVKTLAIRDTVEEEMLGRRAAVVAKTSKMPALTEEAGMRSYIAVSNMC